MHKLCDSLIWRYVAIYLAAVMVVPYAVVGFPADAGAQPQPVVSSATCIVLPIVAPAGADASVVSEKATDALALALEDSREFIVSSKRDLNRELGSMGLAPPLSVAQQLRLAARLRVDKVLSGEVAALRVDERTGACAVRLRVRMLDVETAECLNGGEASIATAPVPGWTGARNQVINDALREASEAVVSQMRAGRTPVGYVTSVNDAGTASVDLGSEEGVQTGVEMLLMRPTWNKDLGEMMMIRVGKVGVKDALADMCYAKPLRGASRAMVGDRAYALYKPPVRAAAEGRSRGIKKTTTMAAALALLFGVVAVASGDHVSGPPAVANAHLFQQSPGDEAVIRLHVKDSWVPLTDQVHGWLFFRAAGTPNLMLSPENLVGVVSEARLPGNVWDDYAAVVAALTVTYGFQYFDEAGEIQDGDVDIEYNHPGLTPGSTYYYRVQRVTDPEYQAGTGAPITQQVRTSQQVFVTPTIDVDPPESLSEGSAPTNPVTYFSPVVLQSPEDGAQNQSTSSITFTWNTALGANEYLLQVFPEDDPDGLRNVEYQSPVLRQETAGAMHYTISASFAPNTRFYWRVGTRQSGEVVPVVGLGNLSGWLYSSMRSLTTAVAPPPPPGTSAAGTSAGQPGGNVGCGFWGLPRYGH